MAQYRHSRLAKIRLTGPDPNNRTFSGTMLAFIFALLLTLVIAGIISIGITFTTDSTPSLDPYKGTIALSDTLAWDGPYSNHISEGWTFVPNVTPDKVNAAFADSGKEGDKNYWPSSALFNSSPYVENIKIRDSWRGWFDYKYSDKWKNAGKGINYQKFVVDGKNCYSAAYIGHFELSEDIASLSLTFHKFNGIAWIYCNGEFIDQIGDRTPVFNLKAFADYCTLIPENGKLDVTSET